MTSLVGTTHDDRIAGFEIEIEGSSTTSIAGALRARGISITRRADDTTAYNAFESAPSAITTGAQMQGRAFAEQPLANSTWELAIEPDVDLGTLSDIKIVVHSTNRAQ